MIRFENVCKLYDSGEGQVRALDNVSLEIGAGEFTVIQGPSGSGKTTLLMALGGMLQPTSGKISVSEKDVYAMSAGERAKMRSQRIGFVFQMFHLLPYLTVLDNVLLASRSGGDKKTKVSATGFLNQLDLTERFFHKPAALSVGEKQRVALARALLNNPDIILADEPTGNLDQKNAEMVMNVLVDFNKQGGTVLVVTHGSQANQYATKMIRLKKGRLIV